MDVVRDKVDRVKLVAHTFRVSRLRVLLLLKYTQSEKEIPNGAAR